MAEFERHNTTCMANLREYGSCSRYYQRNQCSFKDSDGLPPIAKFQVWCDCLCHTQDDEEEVKKDQRIEDSKHKRVEAQKQLVQDTISRLERYSSFLTEKNVFRLKTLVSPTKKRIREKAWAEYQKRDEWTEEQKKCFMAGMCVMWRLFGLENAPLYTYGPDGKPVELHDN